MLVNVPRMVSAYYTGRPDPSVPSQRVAFGTSGHRVGFRDAFNETHILAISQAIALPKPRGITGPLYIASTRMLCRHPRWPARLRYSPPTART